MHAIISSTLVACIIILPVFAEGYATNISFLDCACRWDKKEIVVWIENLQDEKYTLYSIEAFKEWEQKFSRLHYSIFSDKPASWDIHLKIVDQYIDKEIPNTLAKSTIHIDSFSQIIESVSIIVPIHIYHGKSKTVEFSTISSVKFYNVVLHEIGHAIGLGHATENELQNIDPMFGYFYRDEGKRTVSKLDVMTLDRLYRYTS